MKTAARNVSGYYGRNRGISRTTPAIAETELEKSKQVADNAFTVNSVDTYLYKFDKRGRRCTCLDVIGTHGESEMDDDFFKFDNVQIVQDDPLEDAAVDEVLDILEAPKKLCPVCYATGWVNNYKLINSFEIFFDGSLATTSLTDCALATGKPAYFKPTVGETGIVVWTVDVPAYYSAIHKFTVVTSENRYHTDLDLSSVRVGPEGGALTVWSSTDISALFLANRKVDIEFSFTDDVIGFFLRLDNGASTIRVNFPKRPLSIEGGEFDFFDAMTISVDSTQPISTKDILFDMRYMDYWKVMSTEENEPLRKDMGKDVELRRAKEFEVVGLLP